MTDATDTTAASALPEHLRTALDDAAEWQLPLYEDLHRHPELSMREARTRSVIEGKLRELGYEVQEIGGGVVGVLKNGEGRTVLMRADFDGLPVKEATGLDYASTDTQVDDAGAVQPVMHACGHDTHVTAALGAASVLAEDRKSVV